MDIKLHSTEVGEGFPLILLHGNSESGKVFEHQMEYFAKQYHVIALDTRGHGQSPRGTQAFTIRQFADDLNDFMIEQKIDKAHILGFSDGGNIALIFAMKYPEKLSKLIVTGANLDTTGIKGSYQWIINLSYKLVSWRAKQSAKARRTQEMLGLMVNDPNIKAEDLKRISAPTLVMAGTKDMVKEEHTKLIAKSIPNAKIVIIPGTHFIAVKQHARFNQEVHEFLNA